MKQRAEAKSTQRKLKKVAFFESFTKEVSFASPANWIEKKKLHQITLRTVLLLPETFSFFHLYPAFLLITLRRGGMPSSLFRRDGSFVGVSLEEQKKILVGEMFFISILRRSKHNLRLSSINFIYKYGQ